MNDYKELREALAADGLTPGPWMTISRGAYWNGEEGDVRDSEGNDVEQAEFVKPIGDEFTTRGQMRYVDAEYIAEGWHSHLSDAQKKEGAWKSLTDREWVNIVNSDEVKNEGGDVHGAVCEAFKLIEAKWTREALREIRTIYRARVRDMKKGCA